MLWFVRGGNGVFVSACRTRCIALKIPELFPAVNVGHTVGVTSSLLEGEVIAVPRVPKSGFDLVSGFYNLVGHGLFDFRRFPVHRFSGSRPFPEHGTSGLLPSPEHGYSGFCP